MARINPAPPAATPRVAAPSSAARRWTSLRPAAAKLQAMARCRLRVLVIVGVVALIGLALRAVWRRAAPEVAHRDRYLVRASNISATPTPEWLVTDVCAEVIHRAGLDRRLSVLDPEFFDSVRDAFTHHPWVLRVEQIEKRFPPRVHVELVYRRPVAVIDSPQGETRELLPVDAAGVRLPADDMPLIRRQYLPRIVNIAGRPPLGQRWEDGRVAGAVELAAVLAETWESLHLQEIVPSARPEVQVQYNRQYFLYDLVASGGTRIIWGAAPRDQAPGEATVAVKLQRLRDCIAQYGPLDTATAPGAVDVRGELRVLPRIVQRLEFQADASQVK